MKKNIISVIILSLFYVGCGEKQNTSQDLITQHNSSNDSLFNSIVKQFALPYPENFSLDSNMLIFYGSRPFDTSFLVQLKTGPKEIIGVYYEVIPAYHTELNSFAVEESKLLFFEGYSFMLEPSNWEKIKAQADRLLADSINLNIKEACRDCEIYGLSHNRKSNIGNAGKYKPFYKFLKEQFLDSFIIRRKPIIYEGK